jgi:arylsulfatase A-like enzyme
MTNVILLTIDCLRTDFLGCLGSNKNLTPNLDKFAEEGVYFSQAIVNGPSTPFSFPSIFTSTYALMDSSFPKISSSRTSITEILKKNGYRTAGFHSNPYLSKAYNYDKFFDYFYDSISDKNGEYKKSNTLRNFVKRNKLVKKVVKGILGVLDSKKKLTIPYKPANEINTKALEWLKDINDEYFLWIHYMDAHHPFLPPEEYRTISYRKMIKLDGILGRNPSELPKKILQEIINLYSGTIKYVDNEIGKLFSKLKEKNLYSNSLIIITADHGEEFKEHGGFSHLAKLYEELIRVPLLMKGPGLSGGKKFDSLISLIDLAPTILEYLKINEQTQFKGRSFFPLLKNIPDGYLRKGVISETIARDGKVKLSLDEGSRLVSYRTEDWKLILDFDKNEKKLFNLKEDPKEIKNVYNENSDRALRLGKKILIHIEMEEKIYNESRESKLIDKITKNIRL